MKQRILTLHLKKKWFDEIKSGRKSCELRRATDYWRKRLVGRVYDLVYLWSGYPRGDDTDRLLIRTWKGVAIETLVHEEFGPAPVEVFVISLRETA